ncbi:MAG: hypothetical protein V4494_06580 [Chlamydiota bacterium]
MQVLETPQWDPNHLSLEDHAISDLLSYLKTHGSALPFRVRMRLRDEFHNLLATVIREEKIDEEEFRLLAAQFIRLWDHAEALAYPEENRIPISLTQTKKKILVLISEGGGGHKSAGESLREILGSFYDVQVINAIDEVLQPLDSLSVLTNRTLSGEDLYNLFLQWGLHFITRLYVSIGNLYMHKNQQKIEDLFCEYLSAERRMPDLIISTIPVVNCGLILAAYQKNIPFLLLPTDLDTKLCLNGLKELDLKDHQYFRLALPYDDPDVRMKVVKNSNLKAEQLAVTGFPVRRASQKKYTAKEIQNLRKKHGMLEGYETITIVAGAQGGEIIFEHAKNVAKINSKIRLEANVCVGMNERIKQNIIKWLLRKGGEVLYVDAKRTTIQTKQGIILHVRGFIKEIIEIMACSKLLITKTGSCSVNEGIYLGVPLLLDNTRHSSARHFWWERFNIQFIQKLGAGDVFTDSKQLRELIPLFLDKPSRSPFSCFTPPDFAKNILRLVADMIQ